jgi:hypothetical protein
VKQEFDKKAQAEESLYVYPINNLIKHSFSINDSVSLFSHPSRGVMSTYASINGGGRYNSSRNNPGTNIDNESTFFINGMPA